jgi:peptide/nickel transport system permease protein
MKRAAEIRYFMAIVALMMMAVFCIWQPHNPYTVSPEKMLQAPSGKHWFGTDRLGRDLFSRTGLALRRSVVRAGTAEISSFVVAFVLAVSFSMLLQRYEAAAGFIRLVVRLLPPLVFLFGIAAWARGSRYGPLFGLFALSFCFAWPIFNAEILQALHQPHVDGARALGATPFYILRRVVAPHSLPRLLKYARLDFASLIAYEAFLGMGGLNHPPHPALGSLIFESRYAIISSQSWLFICPSIAFAFSLFLLFFVRVRPPKRTH